MVADGVVEVVGFEVSAISDMVEGFMEVIAVAGDDAARQQLLGTRTPASDFADEFALAESWGALRFIPHERLPEGFGMGWVPDLQPLDVPDAWHPLDALFAPLSTPTGELVDLLSVDLPRDRRRPGPFQREVLEMYAGQAAIAISNERQRSRLAEQVRLASTVRTIGRQTGGALDLDHVIDESVEPVASGLRCQGMWVRAFDGAGELPGRGRGATFPVGSVTLRPPTTSSTSAGGQRCTAGRTSADSSSRPNPHLPMI